MPDFETVYQHARLLAALTDPERTEQRHVVTWPIEVAEHWEALVKEWRDPARDQYNGIDLAEVSPGHIEQLEDVYTGDALQDLRNAVALHHARHRPEAQQLERVDQINIDARQAVIHHTEQPKPRRARCGNCGTRYEITEDPTENHHRAMRHARICARRAPAEEHAQLVTEFQRQEMPREFAQRAQQMIAAGADPAEIARTGVSIFPAPRPARQWWKFWKWFR